MAAIRGKAGSQQPRQQKQQRSKRLPPLPPLLLRLSGSQQNIHAPHPAGSGPLVSTGPLKALISADFVYVRHGVPEPPLSPLYDGPYKVLATASQSPSRFGWEAARSRCLWTG